MSENPILNSDETATSRNYVQRWNAVVEWRNRMVVSEDLVDVSREEAGMDLAEPDGKIAVFQHTLDDYDLLFGEIKRLKGEVAALSSARHTTPGHKALNRLKLRITRQGKGLVKYRAQHVLDRDYIQRQKREIRRLNKLVPPDERAQVSAIKVEDSCPLCGCSFPATNHEALKRNLAAVVANRDELVIKYKAVVGAQRRAAAISESKAQPESGSANSASTAPKAG